MSKRFLLIMAVCVAIFAGLIFIGKKDAGAPSATGRLTNHTFTQGSTGVVVIEYGDFECDGCFRYYPLFKQLKSKYSDRVTFQYRHFPIVGAHPKAMAAHRAAEAASKQNKFWEMHDLLYERQKSWTGNDSAAQIFEGYAGELGLDIEKFKSDVNDPQTNADVLADFEAGKAAGVDGTPTFFIDGQLIETPNSLEAFEELINNAIKQKTTS